ncbi:MAG: PqqD family protein [Candidatus Omnitrophica bacterium]|nr:PqqD family protein [Candidatus Omnitrophota bacterium]
MTGTIVYKKNKNMVTRKIADETILLPIYKASKEINCVYTLNKPASIVWDMIDGKTSVGEIKDKVLNNGFDLIKDSAGKKKEPKAKSKEGKAEREREELNEIRFTRCAQRGR